MTEKLIPTPSPAYTDLLNALVQLERNWEAPYPDETAQWAINELSDEGHAHVFGSRANVVKAFRAWKTWRRLSEHNNS